MIVLEWVKLLSLKGSGSLSWDATILFITSLMDQRRTGQKWLPAVMERVDGIGAKVWPTLITAHELKYVYQRPPICPTFTLARSFFLSCLSIPRLLSPLKYGLKIFKDITELQSYSFHNFTPKPAVWAHNRIKKTFEFNKKRREKCGENANPAEWGSPCWLSFTGCNVKEVNRSRARLLFLYTNCCNTRNRSCNSAHKLVNCSCRTQ